MALDTSLCHVSFIAAMVVDNIKDFTRVLYIKLYILFKVIYQDLFDASNVRPVVNAVQQLRRKWHEKPEQKCIMGAHVV